MNYKDFSYFEGILTNRLEEKTMMFPITFTKSHIKIFTNRKIHNKLVFQVSEKIFNEIDTSLIEKYHIEKEIVNHCAIMHDIGHTPFGHAGEDKINELIRYKNDQYKETYPGYFKHNINGAKLIIEHFPFAPWKIIDGVMKHSSVIKPEFNFLFSKQGNLINLNYVFLKPLAHIESFPSLFNKTSLLCLPCKSLGNKTDNENYTNIHQCDKHCFIVNNKNNTDPGINFSSYLTYPYALSIEGAIIQVADELASFATDISDYIYFLKIDKKIKDFSINIIISQFNKELALVNKNKNVVIKDFVDEFTNYINFIQNDDLTNIPKSISNIYNFAKSLTKYVVISNNITQIDKLLVCKDSEKCLPLVSINEDVEKLRLKIKKIVYQYIHKTNAISNGNNKGKLTIKYLIKTFYKRPKLLLTTFNEINDIKFIYKDDFISYISNCFIRMINSYDHPTFSEQDFSFFIIDIFNRPNSLFIGKEIIEYLKAIDKTFDLFSLEDHLNNLYYREVCYFVSLLTDIEALSAKRKLINYFKKLDKIK